MGARLIAISFLHLTQNNRSEKEAHIHIPRRHNNNDK